MICDQMPGAVIRNNASVTYRLLAVTPWNGVLPASATSATAGAAASKYKPKLVAKVVLAAAASASCCRC